ncbi:transposase, partial [Alphaproteobacteria bacterium]|nr:transposase [Alphaproteobacteria bacterium]
VAEALQPGVSAASVARRHGLNDNLLFNWKRKFGNEAALVPVEVRPEPVTVMASLNLSLDIALTNGTRVAVGNVPDVDSVALLVRSLSR